MLVQCDTDFAAGAGSDSVSCLDPHVEGRRRCQRHCCWWAPASPATTEWRWEVKCRVEGCSASELVDGSQNMKQCRGNVWWVRCTELQAREQACWGNYSLMGSFGRQLPGVNVVWRDEVRLKWNFWLENVFKWKASMQTSCAVIGWEADGRSRPAAARCFAERR